MERRGGDRRPELSDIPGEHLIEAYSDLVIFVYRMEYYGITQDENGFSTQGTAELILPKNRFGPLDNIRVNYSHHVPKFSDIEIPEVGNGSEPPF